MSEPASGYLFTSKELDEDTKLYYFGARYYDARTSVWQSADPAFAAYLKGKGNEGIFNSKNLSLFGYSYQNPIKHTDTNGMLPYPVNSSITQNGAFGWRWLTFNNIGSNFHRGVDMRAPTGTNIHALWAGSVIKSGFSEKSGNTVILSHGNAPKGTTYEGKEIFSQYMHHDKNLVGVGDRIEEGQVIGNAGNTGLSGGAHSHFEVFTLNEKGERVNLNPNEIMELDIAIGTKKWEKGNPDPVSKFKLPPTPEGPEMHSATPDPVDKSKWDPSKNPYSKESKDE